MFCLKCGTQLPDGTKFCHICGAQIDSSAPAQPVQDTNYQQPQPQQQYEQPQPQPQQQYEQPQPQPQQPQYDYASPDYATQSPMYGMPRKPLNKKLIAIIASASAAVIAIVVVLILVLGGNSPESIAEKIVEAWEYEQDYEVLREYSPVDFVKYYDSDIDEMEEYCEELREEFEEENFGFSSDIEVLNSKEYSIKKAEAFLDELREKYGKKYVVKGDVQEAYTVKIKVSVSVFGMSDTETYDFNLIKVDGNWYYIDEDYLRDFRSLCSNCS